MEDRSWAEGMSQEEFNVEYPRRMKVDDVIPDVKFYTANTYADKVYGDTAVNPEHLRPEMDGLVGGAPPKVNMNAPILCKCEYCGKDDIKSKFGLQAHMRHCKAKKG